MKEAIKTRPGTYPLLKIDGNNKKKAFIKSMEKIHKHNTILTK